MEKLLKIKFESKPVYGDDSKYIKTKIKICAGSMITNFHNKKMPKEKTPCKCLSIIMLDCMFLSCHVRVFRVNRIVYSPHSNALYR